MSESAAPYANGDSNLRYRALMAAMRMSHTTASADEIIARAEAIRLGNLLAILEPSKE